MSLEMATVMPPPRTAPGTTEIDGLGKLNWASYSVMYSRVKRARTCTGVLASSFFISSPAQNLPGRSLASNTARTWASALARSSAAISASSMSTSSALTGAWHR
ncbi:hypothetical protein G6F59_018590 [Rhizopus arrhizus]|nr:hypothetical protein G6F59_018590 [Rhizopus arrhizus]